VAIESVLVPLDGSDFSRRILEHVRVLRRKHTAVRVTLLRVVAPGGTDGDGPGPLEVAQGELAELAASLGEDGAPAVIPMACLSEDPAWAIVEVARELRPSLVAMATHGRSGVLRWVRGSVAERVLRACPVPVFLANPEGVDPGELLYGRVLVCLDGSERAASVLPLARSMARAHDAPVDVLHVADDPAGGEEPEVAPAVAKALEAQRQQVAGAGLTARLVLRTGDVAQAIVEEADDDRTLVVLTTHGHTGLDRWLFGSVAEKVLRDGRSPLVVQRVSAFPA
jgi:nucleotide-binding universal stress UspA family protein